MPTNAKVLIHYGPYETCGIVIHREARLEGLQEVMEKDGHTVELVQMSDRNRVEIWVNGELIFDCDIRDLDYGGDGDLDEKCHQALEAVRKAY
ncbi:hypothetical protein LOTGIDRAFT_156350 [Lottia gigantea]|uniref:Uncharacterized protein n=1 Tax=Lottia gigantea TaxID=225164 RepID=V4B0R1_LOTGI|nr:hypothetical protein LOTGIDRAFT_156350 [Lottia gigantea]ESP03788.1 hypothetical protein LOTGIDRAFT_156350 [Lottia gigantea]